MKCTRCSWYKNKYNINCVPYFGPSDPEIVFMGEAFGAQEATNFLKTGNAECFIGAAGEKLDELLEHAGIDRSKVGILNAVRCAKEGNPAPVKNEMDACFVYSYKDIKKLNPKLVVALGESALYQTTGRESVTPHRRKLLWSDKIGCKVMVTFHPAACLYDFNKWAVLKEDFLLIKGYIDSEPVEIKHYKYRVISTAEEGEEVLDSLINDNKSIKLDVETTGLSPYTDSIVTVQISNSPEIQFIFEEHVIKSLRDKFNTLLEKVPIEGQGYSFDVKMIFVKYGIFPKIWGDDSCLAEYILEGMKDNDLTFLTAKYAPESFGYDDEVNKAGGAHKISDKKVLYQYGANDIGVLYPIQKKQKELLNGNWVYYNLLLPTNRILTKMSLTGVQYDLNEINRVDEIFRKRAERAYYKAMSLDSIIECEKHFGRKFNPRSSQMINWLILQYYELPVLKTHKEGRPSIGQEEMERYAEQFNNEYCQIMQTYRSTQLVRNNFLSGLIPKLVDGVAHTTYSLHATTTGRPNSKDPNLLNIPRDEMVKRCIVARPGHKFLYSDESQLEVRIAGVVYNEPRLIDIVNDFEKDTHSRITAQAFNKSYEDVYNGYKNGDKYYTELRVLGKTIQFGVLYQMGPDKLSYQLKISKEKAESFIKEYYRNFPSLRDNIEKTKELIIKQGYLDNFFGFRRRWKYHSEEDHNTLREGVNFLVQSLAWNLLELCLIKIDEEIEKRGLKSRLVLQVYDSVILECPDEEVSEVAGFTREIMESVNKPFPKLNQVRLKSDVEVGENLADLKKL